MYGGLPTTTWYCWPRIRLELARRPRCIDVARARVGEVRALRRPVEPRRRAAVQQRVADGQVGSRSPGASRSAVIPHACERRDQQPEAGDRHRERVEVHAVDRVERPLRRGTRRSRRRLACAPSSSNSRANAPSRKWPEPQAGSISRTVSQPELLDRRLERAVEDELLDELRRLQQGVLLARRLGEVLVEVAEEAVSSAGSVKSWTSCAGVRVDPLPEARAAPSPRRRETAEPEQRVVPLVEEVARPGQRRGLVEAREQVLAVGVAAGARGSTVSCRRAPALARLRPAPEQERPVDEAVVLQEAHEHAGEHPGDGRLRDGVGPPLLQRLPRCGRRRAPLRTRPRRPGLDPACRRSAFAQVLLQRASAASAGRPGAALESIIGAPVLIGVRAGPMARSRSSASGTRAHCAGRSRGTPPRRSTARPAGSSGRSSPDRRRRPGRPAAVSQLRTRSASARSGRAGRGRSMQHRACSGRTSFVLDAGRRPAASRSRFCQSALAGAAGRPAARRPVDRERVRGLVQHRFDQQIVEAGAARRRSACPARSRPRCARRGSVSRARKPPRSSTYRAASPRTRGRRPPRAVISTGSARAGRQSTHGGGATDRDVQACAARHGSRPARRALASCQTNPAPAAASSRSSSGRVGQAARPRGSGPGRAHQRLLASARAGRQRALSDFERPERAHPERVDLLSAGDRGRAGGRGSPAAAGAAAVSGPRRPAAATACSSAEAAVAGASSGSSPRQPIGAAPSRRRSRPARPAPRPAAGRRSRAPRTAARSSCLLGLDRGARDRERQPEPRRLVLLGRASGASSPRASSSARHHAASGAPSSCRRSRAAA